MVEHDLEIGLFGKVPINKQVEKLKTFDFHDFLQGWDLYCISKIVVSYVSIKSSK